MDAMDLFADEIADLDREDKVRRRQADKDRTRTSWKVCWPEWEGPKLGGWIEVGMPCVFNLTHGNIAYHYMAPCIIREIRDGGDTFIVEIQYASGHCAKLYNGQMLRLDVTEVWAPVCKLLDKRHWSE